MKDQALLRGRNERADCRREPGAAAGLAGLFLLTPGIVLRPDNPVVDPEASKIMSIARECFAARAETGN